MPATEAVSNITPSPDGLVRTARERRSALQWLGGLPGRLVTLVLPEATLPEHDQVPLNTAAQWVARSPRGNGYLALEPGTRRFSRGDDLIAYRVSGRTAFIVGGTHRGPDSGNEVLSQFVEVAKSAKIRRVLLFPVQEADRSAVEQVGFKTLQVGSEAFVDPQTFDLQGKRFADLRQMVNRATKRFDLGVEELDPHADREALQDFFQQWRKSLGGPHPLRLLVGTPCVDEPLGRRYMVARNECDQIVAAITLTPGWGGDGWGVDVMARLRDTPPGAMDFLLTRTIQRVREEGCTIFSLGACPMAEDAPIEQVSRPFLRWVFRGLYATKIGNRLFHFQGLTHFKRKFSPRWEPVYIAAWPRLGVPELYTGCRMWGLFGDSPEIFND
ncbi:MAG: DUF2156 domain-containing protein [Myxococcales bacterium]|nr:DUF2156 domain-containing protein [Myxococcales bacterium]